MSQLVSVQQLLGLRGDPVAPEAIQFTARPAKGCRGCLFDGQHSSVCDRACQAAERAELDHCERGFIYVAKPTDPRQVSLIEQEH